MSEIITYVKWFIPECVIPDGVLIQVGPPDDEHLLLETCRGVEINTLKKSASSWPLTRITSRCCTVNKTQNLVYSVLTHQYIINNTQFCLQVSVLLNYMEVHPVFQ